MSEVTYTRAELIAERRRLKPGTWDDLSPRDGRCFRCNTDLVAHYGDDYPRSDISGCPKCHKSFCE